MNRQAQAVVMLLLGGAILKASSTDIFLRYVKDGLRPFLLVTGALLLATAAATLWYEFRPSSRGRDKAQADQAKVVRGDHGEESSGDHAEHDGDHQAHHEPRVGWLLVLPALALLIVTPPALGTYAAGQSGSVVVSQDRDAGYPPLPAGDPAPMGLVEYASRAIFDEGRSIADRSVQLTGFITIGPDGQPQLTRIVLSCCAADGRPIKVGLSGDTPNTVAAGTWVQVRGRYVARRAEDPVNGAEIPYLEVDTWQPTNIPTHPYE